MTSTSNTVVTTQTRTGRDTETLLRGLMPDLLAYFVRRLEDREDAADALSETMVVLWRKQSSLPRSIEEQRMYAFGVARKVLSAARRGALKHVALGEALREQLAHQPQPLWDRDDALITAVRTLSQRDQELLLLITWEGFGVAEAGSILGLRPATARARYSRSRSKLRALLSDG